MTPLRQRMIEDMQLNGLSASTQDCYVNAVRGLGGYFHRSPDKLCEEELRDYFLNLAHKNKVIRSSATVAICGIKSLFEQTLQRQWTTLRLVRPPRQKKLPFSFMVSCRHSGTTATALDHDPSRCWRVQIQSSWSAPSDKKRRQSPSAPAAMTEENSSNHGTERTKLTTRACCPRRTNEGRRRDGLNIAFGTVASRLRHDGQWLQPLSIGARPYQNSVTTS